MNRIIIAGPRDYEDYERVKTEAYYFTKDMCSDEIVIVSGGCSDEQKGKLTFTRKDGRKVFGADGLGERLAHEKGWAVKTFDADWKQYGRFAGPIRNKEMSEYSTHALLFWDGKSKGTRDMINKSKKLIATVIRFDDQLNPKPTTLKETQ